MANRSEILHPSISLEPEAPFFPLILASRAEQEANFDVIYWYLITFTEYEVERDLKRTIVNKNEALRGILTQLGISLGKDKELRPVDWLVVGVTDFIPDDILHQWAHPTDELDGINKNYSRLARYLERKTQLDKKRET